MRRSELQSHVSETYGVPPEAFDRLFEVFVAFFDETLEEYVRRRHLEMQKAGRRNDEIYPSLVREVGEMRFSARGVTERRIRRLVYG